MKKKTGLTTFVIFIKMLTSVYWIFSSFTFTLWISVYLFQFYCRSKNPENVSYYLTLFWFQSNVLGLVCSLLTFKSFANVIIIEYIIYITFDILAILQYFILINKAENTSQKRKIVMTILCVFIIGILSTIAIVFEESIVPITWYAIIILVVSRIPQIIEYSKNSLNNEDRKAILFTLSAGILADSSFLVSISIDSYLKRDILKFIPWLSCTILILILDISSLVIIRIRKLK